MDPNSSQNPTDDNPNPNTTPSGEGQESPKDVQGNENGDKKSEFEGKSPEEIAKIVADQGKQVGTLEQQNKQFTEYYNTVQPYIETITADPELSKILAERHQARMSPPQQQQDQPTNQNPAPQGLKVEERQALENQIFGLFARDHGLNRLPEEQAKDINNKIGQELMELADPGGSKNYAQVINSIPLNKLSSYLDKAYKLATLDENTKKIADSVQAQMQNDQRGILSSMPSSQTTDDTVTLTPSEREKAKKMGVTEAKFLERKKQIIERNKSGENNW